MADKDKIKKTTIKVEEIEENDPIDEVEVTPVKKEAEETTESKPVTPVVSSFSQLDSAPPPPVEDKKVTDEVIPEEKEIEKPSEKSESTEENSNKTEGSEASQDKEQISSEEVKEWLKEVRPDTSKENEKGRGPGGKVIFIIVLILFVIGAVVGGVMYFQKGVSEPAEKEEVVTETQTQTPTPEPVEEEEVDLTEITLSVLNGSGVPGEASKVKDLLTEGGFAEDNIQTGNADSYDYETVLVSLKSELSDKVFEAIEASLSDGYEVKISDDNLEESSSYDAVIIVGK